MPNAKSYKLRLIAMGIMVLFAFGCTAKETVEQKVIEHNVEQDITSTPLPDTGQVSSNQPSLTQPALPQPVFEPSFVNYFEHLGFERPTYSDVRIWGWSRDGKVAYSNFYVHEGEWFYVYIFDMVNDRIVWQKSLDFIDEFKNVCVQNGIEFIQTEFMSLPIKHNSGTVNITVEHNVTSLTHLELEDMGQYGGIIEGYKVIAEKQGRQKIIHEKAFQMFANDVFVCGYFLSPFEDRALVVIGEFAHVWEGSAVSFSFVGCHLTLGF